MAILAVYPHARTLQVAAWDEALCEIAIFPLSACSDGIIEQQLLPWLKTFINTSQDLQFIVTSGGTPEFTSSLATHLGISATCYDELVFPPTPLIPPLPVSAPL